MRWEVMGLSEVCNIVFGFVLLIETGFPHCWMTLEDFASVMHLVSQSSLTNSSVRNREAQPQRAAGSAGSAGR